MSNSARQLTDDEYARLLEFRTELRMFLKWSRDQAAQAGLAPSQHQLLLAIRAHGAGPPTIGDVAGHLLIKPHSAAELVSRAEAAGLVKRLRDNDDGRVVRLRLTPQGARKLETISSGALEELERLGSKLQSVWSALDVR